MMDPILPVVFNSGIAQEIRPAFFVDDNNEEVWFLNPSMEIHTFSQDEAFRSTPCSDDQTISNMIMSSITEDESCCTTSVEDDSSQSVLSKRKFSSPASKNDSDEDMDDFEESVWDALRPYRYTDSRRLQRQRRRIPRIPKCDIRRSYLTMFSNAINSHDPYMLRQFLQMYCQPSVTMHRICTDALSFRTNCEKIEKYTSSPGSQNDLLKQFLLPDVFALWAVKFDLNPDHTSKFEDSKLITTRSSETVRLEGKYVFEKTEIYDVPEEQLHQLLHQKVISGYFDNIEDQTVVEFCNSQSKLVTRNVPRCYGIYPLPLTKSPRHLTMTGTIVLTINPFRRIESIVLVPEKSIEVDLRVN